MDPFDERILTVLSDGRPRDFLQLFWGGELLILSEPFTEVASLTFSRLRHICRFEKGGYCKKIKGACKPQNCPKSQNRNKNH